MAIYKIRKYRPYGYDGEKYCAYFWFVDWTHFSLGVHMSFAPKNIEIHLPFGFFRIGEAAHRRVAQVLIGNQIEVRDEGLVYQGKLVEDPGLAHRLLTTEWFKENNPPAEPSNQLKESSMPIKNEIRNYPIE